MPQNPKLGREVLPIPDREHVGPTTYDAKDPDTSFPPIEPLRPPVGAPNALVILLDDVSFGASSAFGGPCSMPAAERLAASGLKYTPLSHHGALLADAPGAAHGPEHFTEDMADHAIDWVRQQKALTGDKPFFVYYAPGATHAPHHVPREWSDKYKGAFEQGWDKQREGTFARQKELGVIPEDAELTPRLDEIPAWDEMPDELKPVLARQMEVYAGFLEHTDHHVGRLTDALAELEVLDNTLIYYIIGDNGASAEGTINGAFNELFSLNGAAALETTEFMASQIDNFGTPDAYNHYAVGWAHAMCAPYPWTKQVASHWGGTRNATIVHWLRGIKAWGQIRSQFHHVIDVSHLEDPEQIYHRIMARQ